MIYNTLGQQGCSSRDTTGTQADISSENLNLFDELIRLSEEKKCLTFDLFQK